jgi:hypothetical protein
MEVKYSQLFEHSVAISAVWFLKVHPEITFHFNSSLGQQKVGSKIKTFWQIIPQLSILESSMPTYNACFYT